MGEPGGLIADHTGAGTSMLPDQALLSQSEERGNHELWQIFSRDSPLRESLVNTSEASRRGMHYRAVLRFVEECARLMVRVFEDFLPSGVFLLDQAQALVPKVFKLLATAHAALSARRCFRTREGK